MNDAVNVFDMIAELSPWWWVAFGIALSAIEMATMSFFLLWPAFAAILMPLVLYLSPNLSGEAIVSIWAILSIVLTFIGRAIMHRFGDGGAPASDLNSRSQQLIGRTAKVIEWANGQGSVEIDGMRWRAVSEAGHVPEETSVLIENADGMTLTIRVE